MPTEEIVKNRSRVSQVVKVTGMSEDLLHLLDMRVQQVRATGRAEYIRELIRRDALAPPQTSKRHKARRRSRTSEQSLLAEYHALVDVKLERLLLPTEQQRLHEVVAALDQAGAPSPEAQVAARLRKATEKLDALLAAVQALPEAGA